MNTLEQNTQHTFEQDIHTTFGSYSTSVNKAIQAHMPHLPSEEVQKMTWSLIPEAIATCPYDSKLTRAAFAIDVLDTYVLVRKGIYEQI